MRPVVTLALSAVILLGVVVGLPPEVAAARTTRGTVCTKFNINEPDPSLFGTGYFSGCKDGASGEIVPDTDGSPYTFYIDWDNGEPTSVLYFSALQEIVSRSMRNFKHNPFWEKCANWIPTDSGVGMQGVFKIVGGSVDSGFLAGSEIKARLCGYFETGEMDYISLWSVHL